MFGIGFSCGLVIGSLLSMLLMTYLKKKPKKEKETLIYEFEDF